VPTPLGNLRDITLRALDSLRDCDLLVAEDTRVARRLLAALDLPGKEIWSYREQNASGATDRILERAVAERVAVVSDAGTPGISDPGRDLVVAARERGIAIDVLPGPSAFVCALVLSGFPIARFAFDGFIARATGERERQLRDALASGRTMAFYEAPGRIGATLAALATLAPQVRVFVARELTKRFEEHLIGTPGDVARALAQPVRGEIVLVVAPHASERAVPSALDVDDAIDAELASGVALSALAKDLASRGYGSRAELYRRASDRKAGRTP